MKADRAAVERALRAPTLSNRFVLLYGPDEAGSRALAATAVPAGVERVDLSGPELKGDPARLSDEAASLSLFGDARLIRVEPAGDEIVPALEALLELPHVANPVVIVAGALKPTSKLVKLALASKQALACQSYPPDARNAPRLVQELAREHGLSLRSEIARLLFDRAAGNCSVIAQELGKLALYLDATEAAPQQVDEETLAAIGAAAEEGDPSRLVDATCSGDVVKLKVELLRLGSEGLEGIPLVRAMLRRLALLGPMRAEVEAGNSAASVVDKRGKAIFWKEKDAVTAQLHRWPADMIARSVSRLLESERRIKEPSSLGATLVDEEFFAICRQAARLR